MADTGAVLDLLHSYLPPGTLAGKKPLDPDPTDADAGEVARLVGLLSDAAAAGPGALRPYLAHVQAKAERGDLVARAALAALVEEIKPAADVAALNGHAAA